jgi:uncharacterized protein (DUF1810 family)
MFIKSICLKQGSNNGFWNSLVFPQKSSKYFIQFYEISTWRRKVTYLCFKINQIEIRELGNL